MKRVKDCEDPCCDIFFSLLKVLHKNTSSGKSSLILPLYDSYLLDSHSIFLKYFNGTSFILPQYPLFTMLSELAESKLTSYSALNPRMPTWHFVLGDIFHSPVDLNWTVDSADPQFCSTWFPTSFLPRLLQESLSQHWSVRTGMSRRAEGWRVPLDMSCGKRVFDFSAYSVRKVEGQC